MAGFLKWAFRPGVLIGVSVALVGAAIWVVFQSEPFHGRPQPRAVAAGDQEVAFLYQATSNAAWERFVAAVDRAAVNLQSNFPGLQVVRDADRDGSSMQMVAEIALRFPARSRSQADRKRLVFRWYKLTSEWNPQGWIDALVSRSPPPLAIIGGSNSYWGRELALQLARSCEALPEQDRPLFLLTTATADRVPTATSDGSTEEQKKVDLASIYQGRTFRFCFTNRQMATAVTRFIWTRPELWPESDPAYLVRWLDDAYSEDLFDGYKSVLNHRAMDNFVQQWGYVSGCIGLGITPVALSGWYTSSFRPELAVPYGIESSVGSFAAPNPYEARDVRFLLNHLLRLRTKSSDFFPGPKLSRSQQLTNPEQKKPAQAAPGHHRTGPTVAAISPRSRPLRARDGKTIRRRDG